MCELDYDTTSDLDNTARVQSAQLFAYNTSPCLLMIMKICSVILQIETISKIISRTKI